MSVRMKNKLIFAALLAMAILVAGCTQTRTVTVSETDGIVIKGFSADNENGMIYSNQDPISLFLDIENEGGTTASNVRAEIIGASWTTKPTYDIGVMSPPDITTQPNIPGQMETFMPTLDPYSTLPEGVQNDVRLTARVTYNYDSNGAVQINVINKNEYKRRIQMQEDIPQGSSVFNSKGPIHLDIDDRGVTPVISTVDGGQSQDVSIRIYIRNVGSGAPISGDEVGQMTADLSLENLDATFLECNSNTAYRGSSISVPLKLRHGEYVTVPCKVRITIPDLFDVFTILMNTHYTYFTEAPLTVSIAGSPQ